MVSKRSKLRNIFLPIFMGIGIVLVVITFLAFENWWITKQKAELTARIDFLKQEIEILEKKNEELEEKNLIPDIIPDSPVPKF